MRRAIPVIFLALAMASTTGATFAKGVFAVGMNESRRVSLRGTAASVVVSDPTIADVTMVDSHSVVIMGHGYGAADVMVLDHAGRILFDSHVRVTPPEMGLVTVHRGTTTTDVYCIASRCATLVGGPLPVQAFPSGPVPGSTNGSAPPPTTSPAAVPGA